MGRKEHSMKEKELRKGHIIDAAERVFFSNGYENASMDNVAKEAGFTKKTIYMYFSSKEQIYFEIMIRGYRLLIAMLEDNFKEKKQENAVDELRTIFLSFYQFSRECTPYFKTIMEYETKDCDQYIGVGDAAIHECYELGERIFGYLSKALDRGKEEGSVRGELESEKTALILWAFTVGVFNTRKRKKDYLKVYHNVSPEEFITDSFHMMMHLIAVKGEMKHEGR
ncbi:TetR/AcrR family transcriptional regulator [Lacrimispora sp.]|uniref:TetR/AcrR family transcriptional regulator n=1 Tax=Lacrimispora sp. TaxID=2719234 RepID=UPI0028AF93E8|nr:TetR/AcrR family transcriptional regulator [Lacrimispora sp.]